MRSNGRWAAGGLGGFFIAVVMSIALAGCGGGEGSQASSVADTGFGIGPSNSLKSPFEPSDQPLGKGSKGHFVPTMAPRDPATVVASRTKYERLSAPRVAQVARSAFPNVIERPQGGPPQLPTGGHVVRYIGSHAAQIVLPGGKRAVVDSTEPMAIETSSGHRVPVDLSLTETGGVIEPVRPVVGVLIPKRVSEGVQMPETGVSLTPVDAHGSPLNGSTGTVDGASVLYANTQTDADTVVKPTTGGVETNTILRSVNSPSEVYFHVGLAVGESLVQDQGPAGPVSVVESGKKKALILPPSATDASAMSVPVSMSVSGDTLTLSVATQEHEYQWPISVDPEIREIKDNDTVGPEHTHSAWQQHDSVPAHFYEERSIPAENILQYSNVAPLEPGESMSSQYQTQGESKIFYVEGTAYEEVEHGKSLLEFVHEGSVVESESLLAEKTNTGSRKVALCAKAGESPCKPTSGHTNNLVWYKQRETEPDSFLYALYSEWQSAKVFISQEKGPELSLDTTDPNVLESPSRENVAYGSGRWLSPSKGAFEFIAKDPGVGISRAGAQELGGGNFHLQVPIYEKGNCEGVQCKEEYRNAVTFNEMSEGEDVFELWAEDTAGFFSYKEVTLNVDGTKPYKLEVTGWPANREISTASHTLTFEATDGTKPQHSSGVGSIAVSVDGGAESPVPNTSCSPGECKASGKWTLNAEGLSEGVHQLVVTATDNAGNPAAKLFLFDVRHASPVSVGPGSVDPTTGQLKLSTSDVSLTGAGGVSRVYQSRNLTAGAEGPLGPQWAISLGGGEGITVLPTGSVVLTSSAGATTTFTREENGEFESPLGDENIKVEAKEKEVGKGITEYLLNETVTGATTIFKQPEGVEWTSPVYSNQFGQEGAQLRGPESDAVDAKGNVWVTDFENNRIEEFSSAGVLLAAYGSYGSGSGQFIGPWGIAINQTTGNVYVTDQANKRIVELNSSGGFVRTFGWGVTDGKEELEVCTSFCQAGIAGSGNGQVNVEAGVMVDPSGNVWVADFGNNRVQEFDENGKFVRKFGTEGAGNGQFKGPVNIAYSSGYLFVVDFGNNRVQEISTTGTYVAQFGKAGSGNGEFKNPEGIAASPKAGELYVTDSANNRVQEFSPSGVMIAKFGTAGSGAGQLSDPTGVVVSPSGGVYVTDFSNHRVEEWSRPTWLPTLSENSSKNILTGYGYEAVEVEGKTVIDPIEALAPPPSKVTCGTKISELKKGCRALSFVYDTGATTATGVNPGQWGDYKGHLEQVRFHGWDPKTGAMSEPVVAEYEYDSKGRLRTEWDPRISPALKTTYGYDEEGHVTAVSPAGQEPWLLHYGTLGNDLGGGRLLSATRPAASTATVLKEQIKMHAPEMLTKPTLSTSSPVVGTTLSVSSEGIWLNSSLAYSYQWYDCPTETTEWTSCSAIGGATNKEYTPQARDAGYYLRGLVGAQNSTGTTYKSTSGTKQVPLSVPAWSLNFGSLGSGSGNFNGPTEDAVDGSGHLWVTDGKNNRIEEFSSSGGFMTVVGWGVKDGKAEAEICTTTCQAGISGSGSGQFNKPSGIAVNQVTGHIYVTDVGNNRVEEFSSGGTFLKSFGYAGSGAGQFSNVTGLTIDSNGNVWVDDYGNNRIQRFSPTGTVTAVIGWGVKDGKAEAEVCVTVCQAGIAGSGNGQLSGPVGATFSGGNLYVTDYGNDRIEEFSAAGNYIAKFGSSGSGEGQFSLPYGITTEPVSGDLYISDCGNNRIQILSPTGLYLQKFGKVGSGNGEFSCPTGITSSSSGELYVEDYNNTRIEKWKPTYSTNNPLPEPPAVSTSAMTTLEYDVPLSGSGLPNLTESEVAKWGQKDYPTEAMAIFPPDKPMGWPAKEYERATINYLDQKGHTVNVAVPNGTITTPENDAIATIEYDETNDVLRTLSADNRAIALKEAESAKVSEKLDSQSKYEEGKLTETLGPEHKVKLAVGKEGKHNEEVMARERVKNFYDEGAPEEKEYGLLTKTTDFAEVGGKEFDVRTTTNSYNGQGNLGWTLRKPTSVTQDSGGLNLVTTTLYDKNTGNPIETRTPKGSGSGSPVPPIYGFASGVVGSGNAQFKEPRGVAVDSSNNVWVVDTENSRLEKITQTGSYIAAYGSAGSGAGQFSGPVGIAINRSSGNVYVADRLNMRVDEFSSAGAFVRTFGFGVSTGAEKFEVCTASCHKGNEGSGNGQFHTPDGVTIDSAGNVWVVDYGNNRLEEFSAEGAFIATYGSHGSGNGQFQSPESVVYDDGLLYVADTGDNRIEELATNGEYRGQFGSTGSGNGQFSSPSSIAADPVSGSLYVLDEGNSRIEEFTLSGAFLLTVGSKGTGGGQFGSTEAFTPDAIAVNTLGNIYATDTPNNRVETWIAPPAPVGYASQFGSLGSGNGQFHLPVGLALDASNNQWVTDFYQNRVEKFSSAGSYLATYGEWGTGAGQMIEPVGIAVNKSSGNVYVSDATNNRVEEFNSSGGFVSVFGFGVTNGEEKFQVCTASCKAGIAGSGNGQFNRPSGVAIDASGNVWVVDSKNNRIEEFTAAGAFTAAYGSLGSGNGQLNKPAFIAISDGNVFVTDINNNRVERFSTAGAYVGQFGTAGTGKGQFKGPSGITADTSGNLFVVDDENNRVEEFARAGAYITSFGVKGTGNGQLAEPEGIAVSSTGVLHVVDSANNRIEEWTPPSRPGNEGAHDTRITYYSAENEAEISACRNHPEWANLPCQTEPLAQPGAGPELPVTMVTAYNALDEAETTTEKFGSTTRTKTEKYDAAGRALTSETTSTINTALPMVTNKYNSETGALEEQSATIAAKTKTITTADNTLGQLVTYTDAEGNATKYVYEVDGRVQEVSDPKGKQTYSYQATTGLLSKLVDSATSVTFTATYDVEGNMLTHVYPDGLTAKYTYDQTGKATGLEYEKKAHCEKTCPESWFSDTVSPSIHGETITQSSTLAKETYSYDNVGKLTETQEIPTGKGCTARLYSYDEDSNRTSLTTRESGTETCPTEGGVIENHAYDSADRLLDTGVKYETFGNTTEMPAVDAGKYLLTSEYYVDGQVATQKQNKQTIKYTYDPLGRTMETVSTGEPTVSTVISHYAGPGGALTWTSEEAGAKWSRDIPGIDGALDAIQSSSGTTMLQLHDLQGNIVATAGVSETETKVTSSFNSTEFGVPSEGKTPPKYAWLGAGGVATELATGVATQGGQSYVPQVARNLQTAPVIPPGAFPNGTGLGSPYKAEISAWSTTLMNQQSAADIAEWAAKQVAACMANPGACTYEYIEDPEWIWHLGRGQAEALSGILDGYKLGDELSGLNEFIKSGIIKYLEKWLIKHVTTEKFEEWAFKLAEGLDDCVEEMVKNGKKEYKPQCRVAIPTEVIAVRPWSGGPILFTFQIPDISQEPVVSYCKINGTWCTVV
jgi:YD repeat-containing protein